MQKYTQADIVNILKEYELKITDHRVNILSRISKAKTPIAVHKLIEDLQKKYNIDQATVYRNLSALEESGLIKRYDYNHGHAHYEMFTDSTTHKIVCMSCENIEKISGLNLDDILKKINKKSAKFKNSNQVTFNLYSVCKNCDK